MEICPLLFIIIITHIQRALTWLEIHTPPRLTGMLLQDGQKQILTMLIYYFKASTTDQYGGTYSTYVNGISSDGIVNNIIPSMQGFFVHVSNGAFPVTGTLGLNNSVRITDLTHPFTKKKGIDSSIPLSQTYCQLIQMIHASADPAVIYFDEKATSEFDNQLDALKLMNTDLKCSKSVCSHSGQEQNSQ